MIFHTAFLQSSNSICLLVSEEKIFYITANQKQELPIATMFLSNQVEMRNLIEDLPQMLPVKCFRGEYLQKWTNQKKCKWLSHLLTYQDEMSILYRGSSIHLAKNFQRRIFKCEKLTGNGPRTPSVGKSSNGLWPGELIKKSKSDEKQDVARYVVLRISPLVHL